MSRQGAPRVTSFGFPLDAIDQRRRLAEALSEEILARRQLVSEPTFPIGPGVRIDAPLGGYAYRFDQHLRWRLRRHELALLQVDRHFVEVTVLDHDESLILLTEENLGSRCGPGELAVDRSWLYERLRDRLAEPMVETGQLGTKLFTPELTFSSDGELSKEVHQSLAHLNEGTLAAVRRAVGSEITYIWGPPGAGKSYGLAHVADVLAYQQERCLVVAPTNAAADEMTKYIALCARTRGSLKSGYLMRFGRSSELEGTLAEDVLHHLIAARRLASWRTQLEKLHRQERNEPTQQRAIREKVRRIQRQMERVHNDLLGEARIVVTTVHQSYLTDAIARQRFECVLIDEAAQTLLPMVYHAASLAQRRIVLAGDFAQLSAPSSGNSSEWLSTDIFQAANLPAQIHDDVEPSHLVALWEQSRMDPAISALCSELFYGDRLRCSEKVRRRAPFESALGRASICWVDTSLFAGRLGSRHKANENHKHADVVEALIRELRGGHPVDHEAPSIVVLTPLRAQERVLRARLTAHLDSVTVSTVHRYQSRAADIVILEIPDCFGCRTTGFMRAAGARDQGGRLINVAISRARRQLVVVADFQYLAKATAAEPFVQRFLARMQEEQAIRPSQFVG
jgi:hypothetical protein